MTTPSRPVVIVTDSTSDIPKEIAAALGVRIVPLLVRFGDETFRDGVDIGPAEFLTRLKAAKDLPKTSQPPVTAFEAEFRRAIEADADVVCITVGSKLSGTFNAARLAAETVDPARIQVIDSGTSAMQLGMIAISAARAAAADAPLADVVETALSARDRSRIFVVLDTLEYVHKGGRIGKASQLVGSVLSIKPILTLRDGEVLPLERVRTWRKALDRMVELAREMAPLEFVALMHAGNPADAAALAQRLADLVPADAMIVTEAGPVLTTYAGPGAVCVAAMRAPS
ncbi:MAG: DegV family protein [Thermomicrobiales bacterium]